MRRAFISPQANIDFHGTLGVDRETLIRIDGNTEQARVGVDEFILVPNHRVPQDTGIIKISQASHVITAIKLGWVDLVNLVLLENLDLKNKNRHDFTNYSILRVKRITSFVSNIFTETLSPSVDSMTPSQYP